MSGSWGHTVRLLTDDERDYYARQLVISGYPRYYRCGTRGCEAPVTHFVGYRYVTGRGGRVSSAERRACPAHAAVFARKHGVAMPSVPEPRQTRTGYMAVERLISE